MKKSKNPKLNFSEVIIEVCRRTGLPENAVYRSLWTFSEVVKECLINRVEVVFADIGVFGLQHHTERKDVVYYNLQTRQKMPPMYQPPYDALVFRNYKQWKKDLRNATIPYYYHPENEGKENENGMGEDNPN